MSETASESAETRIESPGKGDGKGDGKGEEMASEEFSTRYLSAYRQALLARILEDKIASLYRAGKIVGGVYPGRGQEAFSVALGSCLNRAQGDIFGPLIRDQAGRLAFGEPLLDAPRTYFGSAAGPMRGRDGNVHRGRPAEGIPAMISHLGTLISVVCGQLMAKRLKGESGAVGGTSIGDGGSSTGSCHEALNLAGVERLPLVVALANNHYAYSTPTDRQYACHDLIDRAIGYGFTGHSIDGTDLQACLETFATAVTAARCGAGPQLVVGSMLRLSGHGEHDDSSYVDDAHRAAPYGRDCIEVARTRILDDGWADPETCDLWEKETAAKVDLAVAIARKEDGPDPYEESWQALSTSHLNEGNSESQSRNDA